MSSISSSTLTAVTFGIWLALCSDSIGQESPDETLKKLLERYPAADANKDGKLSIEEARAYRAELTGKSVAEADAQKAAQAAKKAKRAGGPELPPDRADVSYGPYPSNKL